MELRGGVVRRMAGRDGGVGWRSDWMADGGGNESIVQTIIRKESME